MTRPLELSTSCQATFWQLPVYFEQIFSFRATFCILSNFSSYFLILRHQSSFQRYWPHFHISQCFSRQFMNFLRLLISCKKRSQILPPGADNWRKIKVAGLLGRGVQKKFKMVDEDSHSTNLSVSGEEGHSTILLAHYFFWFYLRTKLFSNAGYAAQFHKML